MGREFNSKVVLVTGATNGIGLATTRELARKGARIYGVCRTPERCKSTEARIRAETGNERVDYLCADLSSMEEVRRLAREFLSRSDRLDVLVNNAGGIFTKQETTVDGYEMTFALNHLSYFLLTNLLLDCLKESGEEDDPARVVNVASAAQASGTLDEAVFLGKTQYKTFQAYSSSKLCNIVFTYELARQLENEPVIVNALHPGLVSTNLAMNNLRGVLKPLGALYRWVSKLFILSPQQGADTVIWLASAPEAARFSGRYFEKREPIQSNPVSYDKDSAERLWILSEQLTGLIEK